MKRTRLFHAGLVMAMLIASLYASASPAGATSPGSNGMFAFVAGHGGFNPDYQINLMNPNGTGRHAITEAEGNGAHKPRWSPDGSKIAYLHQQSFGGTRDVYVMNNDGTDPIKIGTVTSPVNWSRDGSKLTYIHNDQVWTMNANGTDKREVTNNVGFKRYAAYSPTSDRIYYSAFGNSYAPEESEQESGIWSVNPDGSDRQKLWTASHVPDLFDMSPDGKKLAFVGVPCEVNYSEARCAEGSYGSSEQWLPQVHELDLTRGALSQITNNYWGSSAGNGARYVTYSPDGTKFGVIAPGPNGYGAIYTLPVTGGRLSLVYETGVGDVCTDYGCGSVPEALHDLQWQPCTSSSGSCTATARADLALEVSGPYEPAATGSTLEYYVSISNFGPHTAEGSSVAISWTGAQFRALVEGDGCTQSGDSLRCTLGALALGDSYGISFSLKAPSSPATVEVSATASTSGATDPDPANNSQRVRTKIGSSGSGPAPEPDPTDPNPEEPVEHPRSISLQLDRHLQASGRVSQVDDVAACVQNVSLKIQRKTANGSWRTVDRTTTGMTGRYRTDIADRSGRYRATIGLKTLSSGDVCLRDVSPATRHRH